MDWCNMYTFLLLSSYGPSIGTQHGILTAASRNIAGVNLKKHDTT